MAYPGKFNAVRDDDLHNREGQQQALEGRHLGKRDLTFVEGSSVAAIIIPIVFGGVAWIYAELGRRNTPATVPQAPEVEAQNPGADARERGTRGQAPQTWELRSFNRRAHRNRQRIRAGEEQVRAREALEEQRLRQAQYTGLGLAQEGVVPNILTMPISVDLGDPEGGLWEEVRLELETRAWGEVRREGPEL